MNKLSESQISRPVQTPLTAPSSLDIDNNNV